MFKLTKKKPATTGADTTKLAEADKKLASLYEQEINAHVMPERFRDTVDSEKKAQTTGILVLSSGIIFLVTAAILVYYFLLRPKINALIHLSWSLDPGGVSDTLVHWGSAPGTYDGASSPIVLSGAPTTYDISGLSPGTTYYFAISTNNSLGEDSVYSNEDSATTIP